MHYLFVKWSQLFMSSQITREMLHWQKCIPIYLYCIAAITCSSELNISDASYTKESNAIGEEAIILCHDSYRIYNAERNNVITTCTEHAYGLMAEWCWVPPCEGAYCMCYCCWNKGALVKTYYWKWTEMPNIIQNMHDIILNHIACVIHWSSNDKADSRTKCKIELNYKKKCIYTM
jgi:hypothetical protein